MISDNNTFFLNGEPISNDQLVLSIAALFDGCFSIDWLGELTGFKATHILNIMETETQKSRLLRDRPGIYAFNNPKYRDQFLKAIPDEEKQRFHQKIASVLMNELSEDDNNAHLLSQHLLKIRNNLDNCRCLVMAGDIHLRNYNHEKAFQCYAKVMSDLALLSGEEVDGLFTETAIKYSKISTARHNTNQVITILQDALSRAERMDNKPFQALLLMHIAKNEWVQAKYNDAVSRFDKGWQLAKSLNDAKLLRTATTFSTFFLYWQGRFKEAIDSYEKSAPDVEKLPEGRFPLLAAITAGYCYAQIGQVTQGLGMLDAIRTLCLERGDLYLAAYAGGNMGAIMLSIRRLDDALGYLEQASKEAEQAFNEWVWINVRVMIAFTYYLSGENHRCITHLKEFLDRSGKVHATAHPYPFLMALTLAMRQGKLPQVENISLEEEIHRNIESNNIYMKGAASRYNSYLQQLEGQPVSSVIQSLEESLIWLEKSGHVISMAKTKLELARQHLSLENHSLARELAKEGGSVLASFNETLIPNDLRGLLDESPKHDFFYKEILKLSQEITTILNHKDLIQHVIRTVNRLTGAERGALFLIDIKSPSAKPELKGSKNLTLSQIEHPDFSSSMTLIEEVARTGKGRIMAIDPDMEGSLPPNQGIRSRICVPILLRNEIVGILYHDNRLLGSAFKEAHLELLTYFATLAAISHDNALAYQEIRRLNNKLCREKQYYQEEHIQRLHFNEIIGKSRAVQQVLSQIEQVAKTETTVLITGETGVGKELVALAIHRLSPRNEKPFIRVHCSALPETLIPSELFGHEKGAFTGATGRRIGRFELADTGTLFLDEMGDISSDIQTRLLRVLQTKEFERVGGTETLKSDFRLIVATNRDLENEVKSNRFRSDLYYRLNVFPVYVPPLRERKEDIPLLASHFLNIYATKMGVAFDGITENDMDRLRFYDWPGNIRELENVIERACILSTDNIPRIPELGDECTAAGPSGSGVTLKEMETRHIRWALEKTRWKVRGPGGAAELLDLNPSTLSFRMKKLNIARP